MVRRELGDVDVEAGGTNESLFCSEEPELDREPSAVVLCSSTRVSVDTCTKVSGTENPET